MLAFQLTLLRGLQDGAHHRRRHRVHLASPARRGCFHRDAEAGRGDVQQAFNNEGKRQAIDVPHHSTTANIKGYCQDTASTQMDAHRGQER